VLPLTILLFLLGLIVLWLARRSRQASGLPSGRIIYSDAREWGPLEKPLYDGELGLTGKPDYLVEKGSQIIPVEVKSGRAADGPYDSHIFQLAAYCRLVEVAYGKRPAYGILHYSNRAFAIDYTADLESALIARLDMIRLRERQKEVDRSHEAAERCHHCGYRRSCTQKLGRA
jgi:CRISPR-associated exonuclease Cas4